MEEMKTYRGYRQLLSEPESMTGTEKIRLERIKAIPGYVREALEAEVRRLEECVVDCEKRRDVIIDFLNGEDTQND